MVAKKTRKKSDSANSDLRIIKKYPNRRLYDTDRCTYITLADIKKYVLDQIEFRVIDAQTEADLTKATLFQVITEHEASAHTFFTTELLQQMIRLYHANMQNIFGQYFEQALSQFIQQKETWTKQFEKYQNPGAASSLINPFTAMNEFTKLQKQFWETLTNKPDKK